MISISQPYHIKKEIHIARRNMKSTYKRLKTQQESRKNIYDYHVIRHHILSFHVGGTSFSTFHYCHHNVYEHIMQISQKRTIMQHLLKFTCKHAHNSTHAIFRQFTKDA